MKQIVVTVDAEGQVSIEAVGFRGQSCEKATAALEQAMGIVKSKDKKPDWYVQEVGKAQVGR